MRPIAALALSLLALACGREPAIEPERDTAPAGEDVARPGTASEEPPDAPFLRSMRLDEIWSGDLDGIVERARLRVLVTYSLTNYFLDGARPRGITYEFVERFVAELNRKLGLRRRPIVALYIPVARDRLLSELAAGRADLAAANLTKTDSRAADVDFSAPLARGVRELVVTGGGGPALERLEDLSGREVWVRPSSSYRESLEALNERLRADGLAPVAIRAAEEYLETEDLLQLVNAGAIPITVADSHLAGFWSGVLPNLVVHRELVLRDDGAIAWALRKGTPKLAEAVNGFVKENRRGTLVANTLIGRYLRNNPWVRNPLETRARKRLDGMRSLFEKYAERYDFDWRLLAAQAYQESGLDHSVVSPVGAVGVMQLMPRTASMELDINDVRDLESNIHGGAKYLRRILDTYFADPELDVLNRHLFAVAAYNAGPTRISRLRREAREAGLDPNLWFDNVEMVVARRVGAEPVRYVANVYKYFVAYRLEDDHRAQRRRRMEKS